MAQDSKSGSRPTVTLDADADEWVRSEADRRGESLSTVVCDAVRAAAGMADTPYTDGSDGRDAPVTVGALNARLREVEHHLGVAEGDSDGADAEGDDRLRSAVESVDWDGLMYAQTSDRVDAVTAALADLRDGEATRSGALAETVAEHADVGKPARLLSGVAGEVDAVETPVRGSDRYEWVG